MKFGIHSEQYANNYSKEERKKFTQVFGDLTLKFAEKMKAQVAASDVEVQELVKEHYEFCLQFWTPTKEAATWAFIFSANLRVNSPKTWVNF